MFKAKRSVKLALKAGATSATVRSSERACSRSSTDLLGVDLTEVKLTRRGIERR